MKKLDFNKNWTVQRLDGEGACVSVTLPHDAMRTEERSEKARGEHNIGWYDAKDYRYTKRFTLPQELPAGKAVLEFEGIYRDSEIYLNDQLVGGRAYGYTDFYVDITGALNYDGENKLEVIAHNADQPNSRWYSGTGIYRPVWLYVAGESYIPVNGVKIHTESIDSEGTALLLLQVKTSAAGAVLVSIKDPEGREVFTESYVSEGELKEEISLADARLWSMETPELYSVTVSYAEDQVTETFGIRTLTWDAKNGLAINGERVILKGACIHHDNGVLGACAFPEAEERKIRLLQKTGYNAVRSAHNPCSKAMLAACDRLGVLVMDEYVDMWYIHKNKYDYASKMEEFWPQDLAEMVEKDYNHPSVVLYSTGNEVAETGQERGIALTGKMTEYLHSLDSTRPVTCGINIFFNALYSMGFGVYSDDKAEKEAETKKKTVGSEFYNTLAGYFGDKTMKLGATLPICDRKTRDAFANMDIAGYNYGIERYRHDLKKYPERLILGSETFCKDAYAFYEMAKQEHRIVGDFVWAGMDYIGEAGIGAWEYEDYAPAGAPKHHWLTAGSGRLNILGFPNGEAAYTKVALGKEAGPYLAVKPVYQKGKHSPSAWKMTDAMKSWTWDSCEGERAKVEVYARAASVKLYLNKKCIARKTLSNTCVAVFNIPYTPGTLTAVSYDRDGIEIGRNSLRTAGKDTMLTLRPEKKTVKEEGLAFIRLRYTDVNGTWKPMEKHQIHVSVENGTLEGFGNACSYNPDGYAKDTTRTYYGEALAVVRAGKASTVKIIVTDETKSYTLEIPVVRDMENKPESL